MMMMSDMATPEEMAAMRTALGIDKPLPIQFGIYILQVATGDLGLSYRSQTPALGLVVQHLGATFQLALAALVLTLIIAVPLGVLAAIRKGTWVDNALSGFALIGQSIPVFWLGIMLILVVSVQFRLLPTSGSGSWRHIVLPAVTLAAAQIALVARIMRSSMLEVLRQDYMRTAKAKGLSETSVILRHGMRNAFAPVVTVLGLQVGTLLGGAIITETVFAWPGAGSLIVNSIGARDYPVVQAMILVSALVFVVANLIVDIIYVILDPRVSLN